MARVHTDFIALFEDDYEFFAQLLKRYEDARVFEDVPLNQQLSLERNLNRKGLHVIKYQYVK